MSFWKGAGWGAVALVLMASVPGAQAQNPEDLRAMVDRMQRLERDIRTLNLQLSRGAPPPASASPAAPVAAPVPAASPQGGANESAAQGSALSRLNTRLSSLETDLRAATGTMENIGFQINDVRQRLDKLVSDIDYRLGALEGRPPGSRTPGGAKRSVLRAPTQPRLSAAPSPPPVQKIIPGQPVVPDSGFAQAPTTLGQVSVNDVAAVTPRNTGQADKAEKPAKSPLRAAAPAPAPVAKASNVLPQGSSKEQYKYAFGLLRQSNYDKAELALQEFVKLHPKDSLAGNARYWLGETYYVRAAYVQAAEAFLESYQTAPKGAKATDSLLKLGMSLGGLDKKREACAAFDKLLKDFTTISAGVRNTVTREKQKNDCKK
ncbi:MAG: tol-pal system protein YbgF [Proteobacteria bacterium]|nr:tol-pal system protein YbgF [Pseudomonadota bacterium]MDA1022313.1 tol-pal system protein YbgF [Pseudomonadota bacterium]